MEYSDLVTTQRRQRMSYTHTLRSIDLEEYVMADFKTHWRVGLVTSTVGAMSTTWWGLVAPKLLPLLVLVGWIGSIIPDIDSDTSKPRRFIFRGLGIVVPPVLIYRLPWIHDSSERVVLFWAGCALFVSYPLKSFFKKYD